MAQPTITIALERYDRHLPLFLGEVEAPAGFQYRALEVGMNPPRRDGIDRHRRMLRELEFDAAEVSLSSYIIAKSRGALPLSGIPVFPRRLFSQNQMYVNVDSGIRSPADLIGKRVGVWAFQVTMSVLAKGDLKSDYGVPWERIRWVTQHPEEIDLPAQGLPIERAPAGRDLAEMFVAGEIDAFIHPHPPALVRRRTDRVRRLFDDPEGECLRYFNRHRYYPIMHLLVVKDERVLERSSLPLDLMTLWETSKRQSEAYYSDPNFCRLAFSSNQLERQARELGPDPWPSGLKANRANLERFIQYMVDQRLLDAPLPVESLFHPSLIDT